MIKMSVNQVISWQ